MIFKRRTNDFTYFSVIKNVIIGHLTFLQFFIHTIQFSNEIFFAKNEFNQLRNTNASTIVK